MFIGSEILSKTLSSALHCSLRFACSGDVQIGGWPQGRQVLACISVTRLLLGVDRSLHVSQSYACSYMADVMSTNIVCTYVRSLDKKNQLFLEKKKGRRPDVP